MDRALAKAGKEVMIKSVPQSIYSYVKSIFLIPIYIVGDIERIINAFWWGGWNHNKGIHWMVWEWERYASSQIEMRDGIS